MHLVVIGLNHKTAPVEIREKLDISESQLSEALCELKSVPRISECLILSTCNRTEVYAYTVSKEDDTRIVDFISVFCGVPHQEFQEHLYSQSGHKAAEHLFRVAAGIDSMVLGEDQILGQVKSAYSAAVEASATGSVLNNLFKQAITAGKRARTETEIGRGAFSVGSVAVQLARSIFDELSGRTVLIVGAGKMSELAVTHLISSGASTLLVTNRTYERAERLAEKFRGRAVRFEDLESALGQADVVIASTGAKEPVISKSTVSSAIRSRRGKPIFFVDIAVPRDIEPGVADLEGVFVYDIDDLQAAVEEDASSRKAEVEKVENIVAEEAEVFMSWYRTLDAVPVITALREKLEEIRQSELAKLRARLPHLSEEDIQAIGASTRSIVNKICHQPMIRIKEYATGTDSSEKLETICEVFGICPADDDEVQEKRGNS